MFLETSLSRTHDFRPNVIGSPSHIKGFFLRSSNSSGLGSVEKVGYHLGRIRHPDNTGRDKKQLEILYLKQSVTIFDSLQNFFLW